jgi:hypothetical protein
MQMSRPSLVSAPGTVYTHAGTTTIGFGTGFLAYRKTLFVTSPCKVMLNTAVELALVTPFALRCLYAHTMLSMCVQMGDCCRMSYSDMMRQDGLGDVVKIVLTLTVLSTG